MLMIGLILALSVMVAGIFVRNKAARLSAERNLTEDQTYAHLNTLTDVERTALAVQLATDATARGELKDQLNPPTEAETKGHKLASTLSNAGLLMLVGAWLIAVFFGG